VKQKRTSGEDVRPREPGDRAEGKHGRFQTVSGIGGDRTELKGPPKYQLSGPGHRKISFFTII